MNSTVEHRRDARIEHIDPRAEQGPVGGDVDARPRPRRPRALPATRLGWWSVALGAGNVVLVPAWKLLPGGAALGLACGLLGGILALIAILRRSERAVLVFAAIVPLVLVVTFVLAELLVGHD